MTTNDFDYELDEKFIAQKPIEKRDDSRLLVLDKKTGKIEHKFFSNIIDYLDSNSILVMNDTKVIPARLIGTKKETNATIEVLLLKNLNNNIWECLTKPAKRIKIGTIIKFENLLEAVCISSKKDGIRIFEFKYKGNFYEILDKLGETPLPPYIKEKIIDNSRYQTIYAKNNGSAAAPTAGLHFTEDLIKKIEEKGIEIVYITLHVGLGTFRPVQVLNVENHKMHSEFFSIDQKTANILNKAKEENKKIISVGTTTTRTLETILKNNDKFIECNGWTDIFIYPPYKFKAVDGLITNFHLPKSTLLMLVSAFASKKNIMNAYEEAKEKGYRFFSFGDAMYIK